MTRRWKYDRRVTAMMVEDMIFDPLLAAKVLLQIKLPPHEELRILWMWSTYFTNDDSGFSTGKSFTHAIVIALRSMLFPNRISGIISGTFRQGKLIFQNFDRWYSTSPIFRNSIRVRNGKAQLVHGNDAWEGYFNGGSIARVLPPNFLQDSERLRSERWNDGYLDEWTTFGNFHALSTTIFGRVTKENHHPDCPVRQNHIHMSSTPAFTHHPAYKMVRRIQTNIDQGSKDYGRFTCNYRHVPKTKKWQWLVNRKVIYSMQTMNPPGVVKSEVDGVWQKDSLTYYSSSLIDDCRTTVQPHLKRYVDQDIYVAAFDVARGGSDRTTAKKDGDDFSLTVLRVANIASKPAQCLTVRKTYVTAAQMAGIVHKYHKQFHFSVLVYDPGGGGLFVKDELYKPQQLIDNEEVSVTPIVEFLDTTGAIGDPILVPFSRPSYMIRRMWGKMASDSVLVNRLHQVIKKALENQEILLSDSWSGWDGLNVHWEVDSMREFLNRTQGLSELERIRAEMDLAVSQLIQVDVKRDGNNDPMPDSFGMFKFNSKEKKDSAYGLIYANLAHKIWLHMIENGIDIQGNEDDTYAVSGAL